MKKSVMVKRVLSLFLAVVMAVGVCSVSFTVFAEDAAPLEESGVSEQAVTSADTTVNHFDFAQWKASGITTGRGTVYNVTDNGFTLSADKGIDDCYTSESYNVPVTPDTSYVFSFDVSNTSDTEVYAFFCETSGGAWMKYNPIAGIGSANRLSFTTPSGCKYVRFRADANTIGSSRTFSNFVLTRFTPMPPRYPSSSTASPTTSLSRSVSTAGFSPY